MCGATLCCSGGTRVEDFTIPPPIVESSCSGGTLFCAVRCAQPKDARPAESHIHLIGVETRIAPSGVPGYHGRVVAQTSYGRSLMVTEPPDFRGKRWFSFDASSASLPWPSCWLSRIASCASCWSSPNSTLHASLATATYLWHATRRGTRAQVPAREV